MDVFRGNRSLKMKLIIRVITKILVYDIIFSQFSEETTAGPRIRRSIVPALAGVNEAAYLNHGHKKEIFYFAASKEKNNFKGKLHSFCTYLKALKFIIQLKKLHSD